MAATGARRWSERRQRRALEDMLQRVLPSGEGAAERERAGRAGCDRRGDREGPSRIRARQLAALLAAWNSPVLGPLGGVGFKGFGELPAPERERALLAWGDSRLAQRRAVFQALRKAALLFYYMLPGPGGIRNPAWDTIGYDGSARTARGGATEGAQHHRAGAGREARVRCRDRRLGRRRGRRRGRAGRRRARRDCGRGRRLLRRPGLRGLGAGRVHTLLHGRAVGDPRPERRAAGGVVHSVVAPSSTTRPHSAPPTTCARSGPRRESRRSRPRRTPRISTRSAIGSASTRNTTILDPRAEAPRRLHGTRVAHRRDAPRGPPVRPGPEGVGYCGLGCRVGAKQSVVKTWLARHQPDRQRGS